LQSLVASLELNFLTDETVRPTRFSKICAHRPRSVRKPDVTQASKGVGAETAASCVSDADDPSPETWELERTSGRGPHPTAQDDRGGTAFPPFRYRPSSLPRGAVRRKAARSHTHG